MEHDQELARLHARVAHLEALVERLTAPRSESPLTADGPDEASAVSRRRMLRRGLGLSAAAVAGIGGLDALGSPAAAADGDGVLVAQTVSPTDPTSPPTRIANPSSTTYSAALFRVDNTIRTPAAIPIDQVGIAALVDHLDEFSDPTTSAAVYGGALSGSGVYGRSGSGAGVYGMTYEGDGVYGNGTVGVHGWGGIGIGMKAEATEGIALVATSDGQGITSTSQGTAVYGYSHQSHGVEGITDGVSSGGQVAGVFGACDDGLGVLGRSLTGTAIKAYSESGTGLEAVSDSSTALEATATSGVAVHATSTSGPAVHAESAEGPALQADGGITATSAAGLGASLEGGVAPLRLVPHATTGHPTSGHHQRGELVVDSSGALWLCTKPGSPGKWRAVAFA
ncbi:MAG TPA: hypothetical protein VHW64_10860 [Nocardioides sp.]|uniref:hypothetical protein n=1 Tax=Nocardioides sp. TaxID=35761 RepID=UPI002E2F4B4E|nr:hypothetical protein [Nocardioides sp.]HEX3931200.1 hypothetical protein [Nocardioides sp.]